MFQKLLLSPLWSVLALISAVAISYYNTPLLESIKLRYFDTLIVSTPSIENNIYTVNIDEESIEKFGQWPWSRDIYASIIEELYSKGAGLVVWNVLMSEPDRAGQDIAMYNTMLDYPVILNTLGSEESKNEAINPGAAIINSEFQDLILSYPGIIANINELESVAVGSGIVNTLPEIDGVTRRVPMVISSNGVLYPSLTLETLRVLAGDPSFQIKLSPLGVDRLRIPQFGEIPTDELGRVWIDWSQKSKSISLNTIPDDLAGAIVFVAPTAAGLNNPIATAVGGVWPHELHAAMLGTVFNQSNIERPAWASGAELLFLGLAGLLLIVISRWTYLGLAFFALLLLTAIGGSWFIFVQYKWLLDGITIPAFLVLVGLVRYAVKFISEYLQKLKIKKQFGGYVSPIVIEQLQKNPELVSRGIKRDISIVMTDLRGFTPLGESYGDDVHGLTQIMNAYMTAISQPVLDDGGTIIKYIGDATLHIHGAPLTDEDHAKHAVTTTLRMIKAVETFNNELDALGKPRVAMGAGINTGPAVIGNIGSKARFGYDILGDSVSTAARLEGQSKPYGVKIVIGETTAALVRDDYILLELDKIAVKGKSIGLRMYTVVSEGTPEAIRKHEEMLEAYRARDFSRASVACVLLKNEFNGEMRDYYKMWIARCTEMNAAGLPPDWDGIYRATSK
jgi:adenylate cyclase